VMRTFFLYLVLILGAYLCQTVLYPIFVVPELRVDLFLVLLLHFSFSYERSKALVMALFLGLLMDVGLPPVDLSWSCPAGIDAVAEFKPPQQEISGIFSRPMHIT